MLIQSILANGVANGTFSYLFGGSANKLTSNSNQANTRTKDGSLKIAFVGGAGDKIVKEIQEEYKQSESVYFKWHQWSELAEWIDANQSSDWS